MVAFVLMLMRAVATQSAIDGETLYRTKCASCHDRPAPDSRAQTREALTDRSPEAIVDSLTCGAMRYQGIVARAAPNAAPSRST